MDNEGQKEKVPVPELAYLLAHLRAGRTMSDYEKFQLARQVDELLMRAENMRGLVERYANSLTNISMAVSEEVMNARRQA